VATNLYIENTEPTVKMARQLETKLPVVLSGTSSTLAVGGTSTFTGVATFTAAPVFNGGRLTPVVNATATLAPTAAQSGTTFLLNASAGFVTTLPAPVAGLAYRFVVITTVATNTYKIITDAGTTFMQGTILASSDNLASKSFLGNGTSHVSIIMNSASSNATGGILGSVIDVVALTSTLWQVYGTTVASATPTTPWSTS
jgi:hypothetical protein